jgi:hypothetical protein
MNLVRAKEGLSKGIWGGQKRSKKDESQGYDVSIEITFTTGQIVLAT